MNIFHLNNRNRQKPKNFNVTTSYSVKLIFLPFSSRSNSSPAHSFQCFLSSRLKSLPIFHCLDRTLSHQRVGPSAIGSLNGTKYVVAFPTASAHGTKYVVDFSILTGLNFPTASAHGTKYWIKIHRQCLYFDLVIRSF